MRNSKHEKSMSFIPPTGEDFLGELEVLIKILPLLLKQVSEYEQASNLHDKRTDIAMRHIDMIPTISQQLGSFSSFLSDKAMPDLESLLCSVYKLGEMKGSHNQWIIDQPSILNNTKAIDTKSKTAKKQHWETFGYPKLTALDIANKYYSNDKNIVIPVAQLSGLILSLFEENRKPTISKEKLTKFLKESISIPHDATKIGRPSFLSNDFKAKFKADYTPYLSNDYPEKISLLFSDLKN